MFFFQGFMESYWLTLKPSGEFYFIFLQSYFIFQQLFLLWSIFLWNHPKDHTRGFVLTVSCAQVFCLLTGSLPGGRLSLRPGALCCSFFHPRMGDRCSVITHTGSAGERCFRMHVGMSASTLRGPLSYIPHCPGLYFLSAGNMRNFCHCSWLLSSRLVLALYSHLLGFLGSGRN